MGLGGSAVEGLMNGKSCYIVAEIGLNHNGNLDIAKQLIRVAKAAGADAVKFQKRTPELCVPADMRNHMRETPWGYISYMEYRKWIEFNREQYCDIARFCKEQGIDLFWSVWDIPSARLIHDFYPPYIKIPSPMLTNDDLLEWVSDRGLPVILSTGMSSLAEIDRAVEILGKKDLTLLHCCSAYPARYEDLNLRVIPMLRERYGVPVGWSGHESGLASTVAAVALGACMVERHITLGRDMWGSDQAASLEPTGLTHLIRDIRLVEKAMGSSEKLVLESEIALIKRLRG